MRIISSNVYENVRTSSGVSARNYRRYSDGKWYEHTIDSKYGRGWYYVCDPEELEAQYQQMKMTDLVNACRQAMQTLLPESEEGAGHE